MRWVLHVLGLDTAGGRWYLLWSGIVGDLGLFGAGAVYFRRLNCHVTRCPRIGRHAVDGTSYVVCARHHPDPQVVAKPTAAHVRHLHRAARR